MSSWTVRSKKWMVAMLSIFSLLSAVYLCSLSPRHLPDWKIMSAHVQQEAVTQSFSLHSSPSLNTTVFQTFVTTKDSAQKKLPSTSQKNTTIFNHKDTPKLLCMYFRDRLGNQLFQYASTLGLALTLNRTPVYLHSELLQKVLENFTMSWTNLSFSQPEQRCKQAKRIRAGQICAYDEKLTRNLDSRYDYTVGIWLQSYWYFDKYTTKIRKAVTFSKKIRIQSGKIVQELRQKYPGCTLIGVHIRHGDMALPKNRKKGYPVVSPDFINRSLSYFTNRYSSCVFVVGSDSLQWCRDNFPQGYTLHFLTGNEPAVDMQTLVLTDHVVISFGTFSWWVGFLNRGTTVYMKDFLIKNSLIASFFSPDAKDYIYPGWIPL